MYGYGDDQKPPGDEKTYTYPSPRPRREPMDSFSAYTSTYSMTINSTMSGPSTAPAPASSSLAYNGYGQAPPPASLGGFGQGHQPSPDTSFAWDPAAPQYLADPFTSGVTSSPYYAHAPAHQSPFAASGPSSFGSTANAVLPLPQPPFPAPYNPPLPPANPAPANTASGKPLQGVYPALHVAPPAPAPPPLLAPPSAAPIPAPQPAAVPAPAAPPAAPLAPAPAPVIRRPVVPPPPVPTVKRTPKEIADIINVISFQPENVLAATASVYSMDATRLVNSFDTTYNENTDNTSISSNVKHYGDLSVLPVEILFEVIKHLPLDHLTAIMELNKSFRSLVQNVFELKQLLEGAPNALTTILAAELGKHFTINDLTRLTARRDCEICNSRFAGYLFLPTSTRCCFICLSNDTDFEVTTITGATRIRAVTRTTLLRRVPAVKTIPGNYGLRHISYIQHLYLVSVKQINALYPQRPGGPTSIEDRIPNMRLLAAIALPYYNSETKVFERGVLCKGCELAKARGRNVCWLLSHEGLLGHFESCPHAQKLWKKELQKRGRWPPADKKKGD